MDNNYGGVKMHRYEIKGASKKPEQNTDILSEGNITTENEPLIPITPGNKDIHLPINLPEIESIAQQLNKVSLLTLPDMKLLNNTPKTNEPSKKVELRPRKLIRSGTYAFKESKTTKKRRDPKFIPYEPYKGCVKPIINQIQPKCFQTMIKKHKSDEKDQECKSLPSMDSTISVDESAKLWNRLNETIAEFEKEKTLWEKERKCFELEQLRLKDSLDEVNKHCENLEHQLATQSQVNCELKKLLVASVGEDVQSRVQCLTEDKARMAHMIRKYSEKVDRDYEERERMGIQCDVWHSKFLGSSLLLDDLAKSKSVLHCQLNEAQEALMLLLEEQTISQKPVLQTYKLLQQTRDAFDPLCTDGSRGLSSADLVTTSLTAADQAEWLRDRLLGNLGRAVGCSDSKYDNLENKTPGEKMALKVLDNIKIVKEKECCKNKTVVRSPIIHRYHPNTQYDHVTVNCCGQCNGEIKVL